MRRLLMLLLAAAALPASGAVPRDTAAYAYPVPGVSGLCSANFGEMRPGHFHAGVDIKTGGTEGHPLVAIADGYLSRATVSAYGYGKALYLTLADGSTAVYGHLQRFRDDLADTVAAERLRRRTNSVDLSFGPGRWPVRRGEVIGYSGNSGSSLGPHLHFELREAHTGRLRNIVREGIIRPKDHLPPRIVRLHYVEVDTVCGVCVRSAPRSCAVVREAEGRYRLAQRDPLPAGRRGYFIVETTDRRDGVHNTFGVWRVAVSVDGEPRFEYRMDGFTHDESRCCDAVSCYPLQTDSRNEVIRLAQLAGAPDLFYPVMRERGIVRTAPGERRRIRIEVEDDSGNRSSLEFEIAGRDGMFRAAADDRAVILRRTEENRIVLRGRMGLFLPAGALYEPLFCRPETQPAPEVPEGVAVCSPLCRILDASTPLRREATVSVQADMPRALQLHAALARYIPGKGYRYLGGGYAAGAVEAETRATGWLAAVADTLPPQVRPLFAEGADLSRARELRFRIGDNFSGVALCTLTIDGAWVPCDRFPMQGTLVHAFDTPPTHRRHRVRLTLRDGCGNTTRWEGHFFR